MGDAHHWAFGGVRCSCGAVEDAELSCWFSTFRAGLASPYRQQMASHQKKELAKGHGLPGQLSPAALTPRSAYGCTVLCIQHPQPRRPGQPRCDTAAGLASFSS